MGCCGCSLAVSTLVAVLLSLVESIFGLSWNILVVVLVSTRAAGGNGTATNVTADEEVFAADDNATSHGEDPWALLIDNIKSDEALNKYVFEIVLAALVLNAIWLVTTLALAVGNADGCGEMLRPWVGATALVTAGDVAATIYCAIQASKVDEEFDASTSFFSNVFIFYTVMFSRGGPVLWVTNISLCVYVAQRIHQIAMRKDKRMTLSASYDMMSYDDTKDFRPHTPPPDYEGGRGPPRPLSAHSYLRDDLDAHLQRHRASCTADVLLRAYDNHALVLEQDFAGIPRPTLKTQQQQLH